MLLLCDRWRCGISILTHSNQRMRNGWRFLDPDLLHLLPFWSFCSRADYRYMARSPRVFRDHFELSGVLPLLLRVREYYCLWKPFFFRSSGTSCDPNRCWCSIHHSDVRFKKWNKKRFSLIQKAAKAKRADEGQESFSVLPFAQCPSFTRPASAVMFQCHQRREIDCYSI